MWDNLMGGCRERREEKGRKGKRKEKGKKGRYREEREVGKGKGWERKERREEEENEKDEKRGKGEERGKRGALEPIIPTIVLVLPSDIQVLRALRHLGTSQALACSLPPRLALLHAPTVAGASTCLRKRGLA